MSKKNKPDINTRPINKTVTKIQIVLSFFTIFAEIMSIHNYLNRLENKNNCLEHRNK